MAIPRWLSGLNQRSRLSKGTRRPQSRCKSPTKFAAEVSRLEERQLMSADVKLAANTPNIQLSDVFHDSPDIPLHTITLYNNSDKPIYPIIYAPNSAQDTQPGEFFGGPLFDKFDNLNQDFRGYVGYQVTTNGVTTSYLGLKPHSQVTVSVPLVFWDSGRIAIATDPTLIQQQNNTFNYHSNALRYTTASADYRDPAADGGIVQWYHWKFDAANHNALASAQGFSPAAPAQLLEVTIRDAWMVNLPNWKDISKQAKIPKAFTAVDYDVSYVDQLMLPAGMEVTDATVPFTGTGNLNPPDPATALRLPFGWIGANTKTSQLQAEIQKFTTNSTGYLGSYFGGLGYDQYYYPPSLAGAGINIPAGNHLFADAPVSDPSSPLDVTRFMLASGGKIYNPQPHVGMPGTTTQNSNIMTGLDPKLVAQLAPGMIIKDESGAGSPILQATTVAKIMGPTSIEMSNPAVNTPSGSATRNYTFDGSQVSGTFSSDGSMKITAANPAFLARLLNGMLVSDPSAPGVTLRIVSKDSTSVTLSGTVPAGASRQFTFSGGISDPYTSQLADLWYGWAEFYRRSHPGMPDIPFASQVTPVPINVSAARFTALDRSFAEQFAAKVYNVMINFSKIKLIDNRLSGSNQLMENIIGDNVGFLIDQGILNETQAQALTDEIISLMDGVLDYKNPATVKDWYSAPTDTKYQGGAKIGNFQASYNVYNLNPYVWFVHKELGLTGYAFSVDDGISNVNANGSTKLSVTIGPITNANGQDLLPNTLKYGKNTNFGPVTLQATQADSNTLQIANPAEYFKLGQIGAGAKDGATVRSPSGVVNPLTRAQSYNDKLYQINLTKALRPSQVKNSYIFYDPGINGPA